jgi:hypothetical protein
MSLRGGGCGKEGEEEEEVRVRDVWKKAILEQHNTLPRATSEIAASRTVAAGRAHDAGRGGRAARPEAGRLARIAYAIAKAKRRSLPPPHKGKTDPQRASPPRSRQRPPLYAPLRVLHAARIRLLVAQLSDVGRGLCLDLRLRAPLDKDGLTAPLDCDNLPGLHGREVHLDGRERKHVGGRGQRRDSVDHGEARRGRVDKARATQHKVGKGALARA